ncbi:FkbM family methyltransferase [Mucilaginibacter calamicampi]|uniref:FkbM family methyltransferase n=1 Tax=Mucilaginibacter calamicampi TaxID=1302352 RepID=A0ABW2YXL5_9SPHI
MKRSDRIKLAFIRNWNLPGKERLSHLLKPSVQLRQLIKDGITWLNTENIGIYTHADSYIEWTILSTGTYEDEIGKLIRLCLKKGDNCLDIGGNIGLQSMRMAQAVGEQGVVYAFEPLNYLQQKLNKNLLLNRLSNVTLFPIALSDIEQTREFDIDPNAWNQGTFSLHGSAGSDKQLVVIKPGDALPEIKELQHLALIKIDVEGYELPVLRGLKQTITKYKPRIIFEYDSNYWTVTGQSINECYQFLTNLNYVFFQITAIGCERINNVKKIQTGNLFCMVESDE